MSFWGGGVRNFALCGFLGYPHFKAFFGPRRVLEGSFMEEVRCTDPCL